MRMNSYEQLRPGGTKPIQHECVKLLALASDLSVDQMCAS